MRPTLFLALSSVAMLALAPRALAQVTTGPRPLGSVATILDEESGTK